MRVSSKSSVTNLSAPTFASEPLQFKGVKEMKWWETGKEGSVSLKGDDYSGLLGGSTQRSGTENLHSNATLVPLIVAV